MHRCTNRESIDEILNSKSLLERETLKPVEHFCYPNGDYDYRHLKILRSLKFKTAVTVRNPGINKSNQDCLELLRVGINGIDGESVLEAKMSGLFWFFRNQTFVN